ncbi:MAG: hypothetical protein GY838_12785 [bacterium]|nr:hypothetical protein [bacterium]
MAVGDLPAPVISTKTATAVSAEVVALNGKRARLRIENLSNDYDVWINWGATAVIGQGRRLDANGGAIEIELDVSKGDDWAKDAVHAIATGASAVLAIEELSS